MTEEEKRFTGKWAACMRPEIIREYIEQAGGDPVAGGLFALADAVRCLSWGESTSALSSSVDDLVNKVEDLTKAVEDRG